MLLQNVKVILLSTRGPPEVSTMIGFDPYIFEILNLVMSMLAAAGAAVFVRYLIIEYKSDRLFPIWPYKLISLRHRTAAACASAFGGEAGLRGYVWLSRFLRNSNITLPILDEWYILIIPFIFAIAQCVGLMCIVRVFEPDEWKHYYTVTFSCVGLALAIRFFVLIWGP